MNEHIRELAEHAGILHKQFGPSVETRYTKKKEQDLEKFAKLIVAECIVMADDFECDVNQRGLVDRMKQHFGVK
jgi:hypothetical protein